MAKKSLKKNYIYNVLYQMLVLVTPLVTTPYLSRVLGADGVGTASYIESIVSYFTLFATMGMTTFGQREISYVQDDREKRTKIFWETNILELISALVAMLIYYIYAVNQDNSALYLVLIFNIASVVVNVTWFFQGMEEFGKIVLRNVIFKVINIVYIFTFVKSKDDLIWYLFGLAFFTFLGNITLWFSIPKYVDRPRWRELRPFRHIKVILSLFIPTIAIQIYTVLDKTMIGIITQNSYENGYYEQALKMSRMILAIVTSLGTVMIPRIGFFFEKGEHNEVRRLMYRGYRFVWFLGVPLCFGLITVSGNFVPWFFGEGFDKVVPLLRILSFLILAIGINNVTGMQYLIPTKRQNVFTLTVVIGAGINFAMNMILIPVLSSIGAAIASVTAEIVIAVVQLIIVRKELNPIYVLKEGTNYFIAGAIMSIVLVWLNGNLSPSILHTGCMVIIGGIIYFTVLLIMKDEFLLTNVNQICKKVGGRHGE